MLELFILKRKIKGPCWLTLSNVKKIPSDGYRGTWCRQELIVESPKDVTCRPDDINKQSPPLIAVSLDLKIARSSQNTSEIAMISCVVHNKIMQDGLSDDRSYQHFTYFRKLDQMPLPPDI